MNRQLCLRHSSSEDDDDKTKLQNSLGHQDNYSREYKNCAQKTPLQMNPQK